jgi:hypothetical protein
MKQICSLLLIWLQRWHAWTVPAMLSLDAPIIQRITLRRQKMISSFILFLLLIMVFAFPTVFLDPNPATPFIYIIVMVSVALALLLNRRAQSVLAGSLPIIAVELFTCFNIITIPGGLDIGNLPLFDVFALFTLMATLLLPSWYVFLVALGNTGLICAMLLQAPEATDLHTLITTQPSVFVTPILSETV